MTDEVTNEDRAQWARIGVQAFADKVFHLDGDRDLDNPESMDQAVGDFLCDLFHLLGRDRVRRLHEDGFLSYIDELTDEHE
jgi:hypothetical protein